MILFYFILSYITEMKNINYGIIGTGYFGAHLGRILNKIEGAKVVAIYDPENTKNISEELGCEVSENIQELCAREDIDAIIVASPNGAHKEAVLEAAKNKKHVFCEKPIALSYKECSEMIEATKKNDVIFMAGHVMNFMNGVRKIKQLINDGVIGEVLHCHSMRNGWEKEQKEISWKKIKELSGGHLYHHIHELDFIQFIMGVPEKVTMVGGNIAHQGEKFGDEDDALFITLEFPNKRFATLQYGSAFRWPDHSVKIQGTKGAILLDLQDVGVTLKIDDKEEKFLLHRTKEEDDDRTRIYKGLEMDGAIMYGKPDRIPPLWLHGIMEMEMEFLHNVLQGAEVDKEFIPLLDGTAARDSILTADALTKSLEEDRKVKISELL